VSTGWQNLDGIIDRLRRNDNLVWQVDGIEDYQRLVSQFVASALLENDRMVYMRLPCPCPVLLITALPITPIDGLIALKYRRDLWHRSFPAATAGRHRGIFNFPGELHLPMGGREE